MEPIVWNPCPHCVVALRYVLEAHGAERMGLMVGPIIRMCLECSKILSQHDGGELATRLKLNLPD
jgi:hypothetical protein